MSKQKGSYYENKLVKEFNELGYEAWRVPLSGAIGENASCKVPDRVRKYLVGDICVSIAGQDRPIEVKFRDQAVGFQTIYKVTDLTSYYKYSDCTLVPTLRVLLSLYENKRPKSVMVPSNLLNGMTTSWLDHCDILALRSKKSKEWYFILKTI